MNAGGNGGWRRMRSAAASVMILAMALSGQAAVSRTPETPEARTAAYLDRIADSPPRLRLFLQAMPKGGDLHNHAGGAIYAEDMLRWAAADELCLSTDPVGVAPPPCDASGRVAAAGLERDYPRYAGFVDGFSTRGQEAGTGDPRVAGSGRVFSIFAALCVIPDRHQGPGTRLARR